MRKCNPFDIKDKDCPIFVSATDLRGFLGWGIRLRTHSIVNHSMILYRQGYFVSQSWVYKEIPIERYVKKGIMLKLWQCKDITKSEKRRIFEGIRDDLSLPFWERMYDCLGIVGQLVGLRWLNIPQLNYCSERVAKRVRVLLPNLKKHPTPAELDEAFKKSKRFKCLGYYICE